jgi:hypothetical protein
VTDSKKPSVAVELRSARVVPLGQAASRRGAGEAERQARRAFESAIMKTSLRVRPRPRRLQVVRDD